MHSRTHTYTLSHNRQDDPKKSPQTLPSECTAADIARTIPNDQIGTMIRTLSRRPAGRDAILNSPLVKRTISQSTRQVKKTYRWRRGEKLAKLAAKQAAQAKGCATKSRNKLRRAEARNKGIRNMLTKVEYTHIKLIHSIICKHARVCVHAPV